MELKELLKASEDLSKDTVCVFFGDDGIACRGGVSKEQHAIGILAAVAALIQRCGGNPDPVNDVIRDYRNAKKEEPVEDEPKKSKKTKCDIKIGKIDLKDKDSVNDFIKVLKEAAGVES